MKKELLIKYFHLLVGLRWVVTSAEGLHYIKDNENRGPLVKSKEAGFTFILDLLKTPEAISFWSTKDNSGCKDWIEYVCKNAEPVLKGLNFFSQTELKSLAIVTRMEAEHGHGYPLITDEKGVRHLVWQPAGGKPVIIGKIEETETTFLTPITAREIHQALGKGADVLGIVNG